MHNKTDVSIIIVNYYVKRELFVCIQSIIDSNPKVSYEIIVVDNDDVKNIQKDLHKKFPRVTYIPNENKGFGHGNNTGAHIAKGKYLFFLNPDTKVFPNCIDRLITYLKLNKDIGIVAPMLYDKNNVAYPQGANELTPVRSIFVSSFIHTILPNNPIAKKYWLVDEWDRKSTKDVASVPGTAFVIRRDIFKKVNGFDEFFFLYFEELDICKRVKNLGWRISIYPSAKVFHALGRSTSKVGKIQNIFQKSRFYYFKKHYGLISALLTESVMRISKNSLLLFAILLFGVVAAIYKIDELMTFIGDQGWYYLSARDILLNGAIPLIGIPSSHPWLHQGAFWTYLLTPLLGLFNFNPVSGVYLSIAFHLATVCFLYFITKKLFSDTTALISAFLFALSPLVLLHARTPYHTTPIPLLSLLFYFALYKWIKGNPHYFPFIIFLLALLYNFEIATFLLSIVFFLLVFLGLAKKANWMRKILNRRIILLSIAAFILPMLPMLLYDLSHGFPQTILFLAWVGYKILVLFGYPPHSAGEVSVSYASLLLFLGEAYKNLIYSPSSLVSFTIGLFSFGYLGKMLIEQIKIKVYKSELLLLALIVIIGVLGILATKTASVAYLPILYPFIILITALFFTKILKKRPRTWPLIVFILLFMAIGNNYHLIAENYFTTRGVSYADKLIVAKKIVSDAGQRRYNLIGKGIGSEHESFLSSYRYLAWWQGNEPVNAKQQLRFIIQETPKGIRLTKEDKKL